MRREALLTIARPDSSLARMEWLVDSAQRVLDDRLRAQPRPPADREASRRALEPLAIKPERLAERIDEALAERDPRRRCC